MALEWVTALTRNARASTWAAIVCLVVVGLVVLGLTHAGSVFAPLVLAAFISYQFVRARQRARRSADLRSKMTNGVQHNAALHEGMIAILGKVKYRDNATYAVEAEIDQYGMETEYSGGWHHEWIERKRQLNVHPFGIELADGSVVIVEPPETGLLFADVISHQTITGPTQQLVARLDANEEVVVVGSATLPMTNAPYREVALGWRLRGAPMWIVSTSTASDFDERARLHRRQSFQYLALIIPLALVILRVSDRVIGHTEPAVVTSSEVVGASDKNDRVHTCVVGRTTSHCERGAFLYRKGDKGFLRVGHCSANFGAEAKLAGWEHDVMFYVCIAALAAAFVFRRSAYRSLPWYRRASYKLQGDGQLPRNS